MKKGEKKYVSLPLERSRGILPDLFEADIILVHTRGNFIRYLIRKLTNSYWDHVAMVLFPKDYGRGRQYNQIVEAVYPRGIEIHKLDKYFKDPERYDVGIKRIPLLDDETRKRVVQFMLMNVDAPYYKGSKIGFVLAFLSKKFSAKFLMRQRFCSSSFVQKSFYDAVNWEQKNRMIFRNDFISSMELHITTPADIAKSNNAKWIYGRRM